MVGDVRAGRRKEMEKHTECRVGRKEQERWMIDLSRSFLIWRRRKK